MEGEPCIADATFCQGSAKKVQCSKFLHAGPCLAIQPVKKVKIEVVGLKPCQLLTQDSLEIVSAMDEPRGKLRCKEKFFAVRLQRFAHETFALSTMIWVGRIEVVDPVVDGGVDHFACQPFIDGLVRVEEVYRTDATHDRKAHTAEAKDRYVTTGLAELSVQHKASQ